MRKLRHWQVVFILFCLVWAGWVIKAGETEFDRIHKQYRTIAAQLEPGELQATALAELTRECLANVSRNGTDPTAASCSAWPPEVVVARQEVIEHRLHQVRKQAKTKIGLFYSGFVILFLVAPPLLVYLLIAGLIRIFSVVKIVKK